MEIILGKARRRWSDEEKRALVAETFAEGETVHGVARRHGVSSSMLFGWRKQYREAFGFPASANGTRSRRGIKAEPTPHFAPVAIGPPAISPPSPSVSKNVPAMNWRSGAASACGFLGRSIPILRLQ